MVRLVSWNMRQRNLWSDLTGLGADVALVQEARPPLPSAVREVVPDVSEPWTTAAGLTPLRFRTAIARLSDEVALDPHATSGFETATAQTSWVVSRPGTITAADVMRGDEVLFTAVSVYAPWEGVRGWIYADGSAHRILSDLSALVRRRRHRLVVAGDWNILRGYGEYGNREFAARYATVFDRAEALGLRYVGPNHPNGRPADPWPTELPSDSLCVPTFHHSQQKPATATRQIDFAFASPSIADRVVVRALNEVDDWGRSDHCRILIDVDA